MAVFLFIHELLQIRNLVLLGLYQAFVKLHDWSCYLYWDIKFKTFCYKTKILET